MFFNSLDFGIFLPIVFLLYWFVFNKNLKVQNGFVLLVSYIFYGWWDWKFLSLIIFSTILDYVISLQIKKSNSTRNKKLFLLISLFTNLGFLGFFKYYNFFVANFITAFSFFGQKLDITTLNIILPVGISFYTFQTLSYTIDVYREKLEPTKDFIEFGAFVSFFPQLVAGPIERATYLLPQFYKKRSFSYEKSIDGLKQMLWGFYKKIVIADNCAVLVDQIFSDVANQSGSTLFIGAILFSIQIYCDFSGYSDIAIGTARLFGFDLMQNFAFPYFSRNVAEFWRRWHISLSTWFRDYLYIPLGGSKVSRSKTIRNTFIIFIVSGFWHGANWTFIIWGALHALYILPSLLTKQNRKYLDSVAKDKLLPSFSEFFNILATFLLVVIAWIFFRADSVSHALAYITHMFSYSLFSLPDLNLKRLGICIFLLILIEWLGRCEPHALKTLGSSWHWVFRWAFYYILLIIIFIFYTNSTSFIYFQF